jgi:Effector-associated domain 11
MDAQNIKDLLSQNQWETVFTALKKIESNDENWSNQVVQLESRYRSLKLDKVQGVITNQEVNLETNRIRESILLLVHVLPAQTPPVIPPLSPSPPSSPEPISIFSIQRILIISTFIISVIVLVVFLSKIDTIKENQVDKGNPLDTAKNNTHRKHILDGQIQSNGVDLEGVEVRIMGTGFFGITDSTGFFKLDLPSENLQETYLISLQKTGYETQRETYEMHSSQSPIYNLIKEK